MCYNCGCGNPHDDMGHPHNITRHTLEHLAADFGKSEEEMRKIMLAYTAGQKGEFDDKLEKVFSEAAVAWGQSVDNAKQETKKQLEKEAKHA